MAGEAGRRLLRRRSAGALDAFLDFPVSLPLLMIVVFYAVWRIIEVFAIVGLSHCEWMVLFTHRDPGRASVYWSLVAILALFSVFVSLWITGEFQTRSVRWSRLPFVQHGLTGYLLASYAYLLFLLYGVLVPYSPAGDYLLDKASRVPRITFFFKR
ncbi:MAG: hypothetical protein AAFV51_13415 [Pseudomonadota bacterium]